ncbi:MAG: metallophosphoesterase [Clostridia bacterium]|nr:metallophosphoesterase [Clostridia bacterium]
MFYRPRHRAGQKQRALWMHFLTAVIVLLVTVIVVYPFLEPLMLQTEYVTLTSPSLPREIGTLRIVYLSDIHYDYFFGMSRVKDLVSKVNALNADIVLLGGDYAADSDGAIEFFRTAPQFNARIAVCAVVGNHDRTLPESNLLVLQNAMRDAGVIPLVNDVAQVRFGAGSIYVAGIDDMNNGHPDLASVAARVKSGDYVIFLAHSPAAIDAAARVDSADGMRTWYDLGLFGHTHGGQVALFGSLLNISDVPSRYESGWKIANRTDVLISNGVGTSVLPIRIFRQPQIHVITVKSGS